MRLLTVLDLFVALALTGLASLAARYTAADPAGCPLLVLAIPPLLGGAVGVLAGRL
jgi:hypothetical protein